MLSVALSGCRTSAAFSLNQGRLPEAYDALPKLVDRNLRALNVDIDTFKCCGIVILIHRWIGMLYIRPLKAAYIAEQTNKKGEP